MKIIELFGKYVTLQQKKKILVDKLQIDAVKLSTHLSKVFGNGLKYNHRSNFYKVEDDVFADINRKCDCNRYYYNTEFKSNKFILSPYAFKFEIVIFEGRKNAGVVFMTLNIIKGAGLNNPTRKKSSKQDIENEFVNDIFYYFNTIKDLEISKQSGNNIKYNIYDENIDDLINQISLEDFEMKLVAKKYNIG